MNLLPVKSLVLVLLLVSSATFVSARPSCTPIEQTSEILFNLRLGNSVPEVSQILGKGLKIKTKSDGDYRFFQNYIGKKPPANLTGVRAFYLRFFEKKLYQIEFFYEETKYPTEINDFAQIISNQLNLPFSEWTFAHRQAVRKCGEISFKADYQLNPRIELTNEAIREKVAQTNQNIKLF